jgi:DNA-binding MarR family transcriptional regulator
MPLNWKKITKFKGPEESPGFVLWQVSNDWRRQIEASLKTIDLTHPQFVILACVGWLTRNGEEVTQIEIARHARTDVTMTSQVLRTLEKKGVIERAQKDARSKYPQLTTKGKDLVASAIPLVEKVDAKFFKKEGPSTLKALRKLL